MATYDPYGYSYSHGGATFDLRLPVQVVPPKDFGYWVELFVQKGDTADMAITKAKVIMEEQAALLKADHALQLQGRVDSLSRQVEMDSFRKADRIELVAHMKGRLPKRFWHLLS